MLHARPDLGSPLFVSCNVKNKKSKTEKEETNANTKEKP
jgi:hypothetical protein